PLMTGPLIVLSGATALGGVVVALPHFLGVGRESFHPLVMLAGAAVVAGGALFTLSEWWRLQHGDPARMLGRWQPVLEREFSYDRLLGALIVRPTQAATVAVMATESDVVDAYVRGAGTGSVWGGRVLSWLHNGNLQRYVTAVVLGAVAVAL